MVLKLTLTLFASTLLSLSFGQLQSFDGYVHPQEMLRQLKRAEAALPFLSTVYDDFDTLKDVFTNPKDIFRYISSMSSSVSSTCLNQTLFLLDTIGSANQSKTWALKMVDAWGKPEPGILEFHLQWLGNFDECVGVQSAAATTSFSPPDFHGKYCTISTTVGTLSVTFGLPASLNVGGCFPSACSEDDITNVIGLLTRPLNLNTTVTVACQDTNMPLSGGAIVCIVVYSFIGALCLLGTLYDIHSIMTTPDKMEERQMNGGSATADGSAENSHMNTGSYDLAEIKTSDTVTLAQGQGSPVTKKTGVLGEVLMCFSLYTNGYRLLSTKQPPGSLHCINGIRFISMTWVILGHTLTYSVTTIENFLGAKEWMKRWTFAVINNATVAVDSFFVLSAFLTTYLLLKDIERRKPGILKFLTSVPVMYLHRYIRLTPAYASMVLFYATMTLYVFNGPLKLTHTDVIDVTCKTNWWTALLYINNVVEPSKLCAGWGWYLSNDFQFFLVTPFVVLLMYKTAVGGMLVAVVMVITSAGAATGISAIDDLGIFLSEPRDPKNAGADALVNFSTHYYIAPWTRYQSFGVGIILGFVLWRMRGRIRLPTAANLMLWAGSALVMLLVIYGPYEIDSGHRIATPVEAAIYNGWARLAWSLALSYIILSCCLGQGGWVNELLSWSGFVPLSRMSYCAYLVHPVIITIFSLSAKNKTIWTDFTVVSMDLSYITLAYSVAFLFALMFEVPFMLLDKKFITGKLSRKLK